MANFDQICRALGPLISDAINASSITVPSKTIVGWPVPSEAVKLWGKGEFLVSIWPAGNARPVTRYAAVPFQLTPPTITLTAEVAGLVVTFGGDVVAGFNVHCVLDTIGDAYYRTFENDTLDNVAAGVAAAVNALDLAGVSASAIGAVLTVVGVRAVVVNIGKALTMVKEVARMQQDLWVISWPASPSASDVALAAGKATRAALDGAILGAIGGTDKRWFTAGDGSRFSVDLTGGPRWSDKAESSYTVFRSDIIYTVEYPVLVPVAATPIGVIAATVQLDAQPARTSYFGGP